jgi:hypothetical protein
MTQLGNNIDPATQAIRISFCTTCEENIELPYPKCRLNDIPLSVQTSEEQETCPLNKW